MRAATVICMKGTWEITYGEVRVGDLLSEPGSDNKERVSSVTRQAWQVTVTFQSGRTLILGPDDRMVFHPDPPKRTPNLPKHWVMQRTLPLHAGTVSEATKLIRERYRNLGDVTVERVTQEGPAGDGRTWWGFSAYYA